MISPSKQQQQQQQQKAKADTTTNVVFRSVSNDEYWSWQPNAYWEWHDEPEHNELFSIEHIEENLQQDAERRNHDEYWDMSLSRAIIIARRLCDGSNNAAKNENSKEQDDDTAVNDDDYWNWKANPEEHVLALRTIEANLLRDAKERLRFVSSERPTNADSDDYWDESTTKDREAKEYRQAVESRTASDLYWMEQTDDPTDARHPVDNSAYWEWTTTAPTKTSQEQKRNQQMMNLRSDGYWCW